MDQTEFFARDGRSAGIRNSRFVRSRKPWPYTIKLEGSRWIGKRKISLLHVSASDLASIPSEVLVYGRNGVEHTPIQGTERELGLIIETTADTPEAATTLASLLAHYLLHFGYPGRKATGGNIAYPLSPNLISFARREGTYGAIVPGGTRDPIFIEHYPRIKPAVVRLVEENFPRALANAQYRIIEADASKPTVLLRTIDRDVERLNQRHAAEIESLVRHVQPAISSLYSIDAGDAYEWSLYHLLQNEALIKDELFPVRYYRASGREWVETGHERPRYFDIGVEIPGLDLDERSLGCIADATPSAPPQDAMALVDMAVVIRSKNAGVNRLTFDVIFNSASDYELALRSNLFFKDNIAPALGVSADSVIGSYFVDACNAIKITLHRPALSAGPDERDVFGAQQQARLEALSIPIHLQSLVKYSAF